MVRWNNDGEIDGYYSPIHHRHTPFRPGEDADWWCIQEQPGDCAADPLHEFHYTTPHARGLLRVLNDKGEERVNGIPSELIQGLETDETPKLMTV